MNLLVPIPITNNLPQTTVEATTIDTFVSRASKSAT